MAARVTRALAVCVVLGFLAAVGSRPAISQTMPADPVEALEAPWTSEPKGVGHVDMRLLWTNPAGRVVPIPRDPNRHSVGFNDTSNPVWATGYGLSGNVLRVAVGETLDAPGLRPGKRYSVQVVGEVIGGPLLGEVLVPQVKPGETATVDVMLKPMATDIHGGRANAIAGSLKGNEWRTGAGMVYYAWSKEFSISGQRYAGISPDGTFRIGDVPLGGDLMISGGKEGPCAMMVAGVQKRDLRLPEDATLVPSKENLIACKVRYTVANATGQIRGLIFMHEQAPRLPFASYPTDESQGELAVMLVEGRYRVCAIDVVKDAPLRLAPPTTQGAVPADDKRLMLLPLGKVEIRKGTTTVTVQ